MVRLAAPNKQQVLATGLEQINRGHPLAIRLSRCWLLGIGGQVVENRATGIDRLVFAGNPALAPTARGFGKKFTTAGQGGACSWTVPTTWSIEFWINPTAGFASNFGVVLAQATNEHGVYITRDGSDACYVEAFDGAALTTTAGSITKGALNHVVVTYDSASLYRIYINAVLVYTSGANGNFSGPLDHVGEHGTDNPVQGTIPLLRVWDNRVLGAADVQQLYVDPFEMFYAGYRLVPNAAAGGGTVSLSGAATGQGAAAAAPLLALPGGTGAQGGATGSLTISLSGGAGGQASATAAPTLGLAGGAAGQASGAAAPTIRLTASAVGQGAAAAAPTLALSGATSGQASGSAAPTLLLAASVGGQGAGAAAPTIRLSGAATGQGSAAAGLTISGQISLAGSAGGSAVATAALAIALSGASGGAANTSAGPQLALPSGVVVGQATALAAPMLALAGAIVAQAIASGALQQTTGTLGPTLRRTITGAPLVRHTLTGAPLVRHTLSGEPV